MLTTYYYYYYYYYLDTPSAHNSAKYTHTTLITTIIVYCHTTLPIIKSSITFPNKQYYMYENTHLHPTLLPHHLLPDEPKTNNKHWVTLTFALVPG